MDTEIELEWQIIIIDTVVFEIYPMFWLQYTVFFYNLSHAENIVWVIKGKITVQEIQGKLTIHVVRVCDQVWPSGQYVRFKVQFSWFRDPL